MRQIDADEFSKQMSNIALKENWELAKLMTVLILIDRQPTCYDVEKVIEQLKQCGKKMSEAKTPHQYYKAISIKKAVEIIKGGSSGGYTSV